MTIVRACVNETRNNLQVFQLNEGNRFAEVRADYGERMTEAIGIQPGIRSVKRKVKEETFDY